MGCRDNSVGTPISSGIDGNDIENQRKRPVTGVDTYTHTHAGKLRGSGTERWEDQEIYVVLGINKLCVASQSIAQQ